MPGGLLHCLKSWGTPETHGVLFGRGMATGYTRTSFRDFYTGQLGVSGPLQALIQSLIVDCGKRWASGLCLPVCPLGRSSLWPFHAFL